MGDLKVCSLPRGDGVLRRESENNHLCSGGGSGWVNLDPGLVQEVNWRRAEEAAREILHTVHPTVDADCRRKEVTEYVKALIKSSLGFEVFPYGSVPLKTYLPDGDIDLTAISSSSAEDGMFSDVHAVLRREERNREALCEVKDVHVIDAEVKLVKCIVQNMVVDISFNQLGGLSTLCFLEQVDRLVGKNHLFKHSIILIKSWCYYESRILGAHHGLISTYALETLVLYIFNLFHSSLNGPLAVLFKFLDYFSKFDWDNYCISLNGPVCKASLPNIVVEPFDNGRGTLLLKDEFLRKCVDMFSPPSKNPELNSRPFPQKHLNIVDPLKSNNNLGRSVNRGNFYRIRSAFKYGARKLGRIFSLPSERMVIELNKFFGNTLDRHRSNYWTPVESSLVLSFPRNSDNSSSSSFSDSSSEDGKSALGCSADRPFRMFSRVKSENGISNGKPPSNFASNRDIRCGLRSECKENHIMVNSSACSCTNNQEDRASFESSHVRVKNISANLTPALEEREFAFISENSHPSKSLLDLSGDYDSQFRSVVYGQYCHFYALSAHVPSYHPMLHKSKIKNPWQTIRESLHLKRNVHPHRKSNGILDLTLNSLVPFSEDFNYEEKKKRGTGTYIPNTFYYSDKDRLPSRRGKNQDSGVNVDLHRHDQGKDCASTPIEINSSENSYGLSEADYPYLGNGKPASSELSQPSVWGVCSVNSASEVIDSGCQDFQLPEESSLEAFTEHDVASTPVETAEEISELVVENDNERVELELYHLKDEADFPPLSYGR
ncbi:PAP/OAS1 substrate-binding domain superfamily [Euphorbia peplus]|nr:PAP/OAS1 substrate-binding domain superfamily [Euphorbia peplus]